MGDRRLKTGAFLGIWAVLVGVQSLAWVGPLANLGPAVQVAWFMLFQVAKIWPTMWRLNDTGRDPSDAAFFTLVPIVNVAGFFVRMLEGTPTDRLREKRRAQWLGRPGAFAAIRGGLTLVRDTLPLGLPLVLVYAAVAALGGHWMLGRLDWAQAADPATLQLVTQVLWALAGFLGLYTLLQFGKRRSASRASWLPSLFLGPVILAAGAFTLMSTGMGPEIGPALVQLLLMSWNLLWASIGGAALAVGQVTLGHRATRGESIGAGELLSTIRRRTVDVAGPHGARVHAVTVGMQVIIPGVFYALQLAFTDMIAVLQPEAAALDRSGRLTWGMRSRLFKVFFLWFVVAMGLATGLAYVLEPFDAFTASFIDPRALGLQTFVAQEIVWALASWVLEMALLVLYFERVAREESKRAVAAASPEPVMERAESAS